MFIEAVLWAARTGSPWHDLPPFSDKWNTMFKRFRDWEKWLIKFGQDDKWNFCLSGEDAADQEQA